MTKHIRVEQHPNRLFRSYHTTDQLSDEQVCSVLEGASLMDPFKGNEHLSNDTKTVLTKFYDAMGVWSVDLGTHRVSIKRDHRYEWRWIEPDIINVINDLLGWDDQDVVITYHYNGEVLTKPVADRAISALHQELVIKGILYPYLYYPLS